jgi:tetratricopeptide (TPR) repeat protein
MISITNNAGANKLIRSAISFALLLFLTATAGALDQVRIIIFPLEMPSNVASLSWLSEGVAVSVSEQLRGHGVRAVDRNERVRLVEDLDLPPGAFLSKGSMIRVAQQAGADLVVMGAISGADRNLKISLRVLDIKNLRLSGEMTANGPLAALPQMENELSWLILSNTGLDNGESRKNFQNRGRKVPNSAFALYISSFSAANKNEQMQLLTKAVDAYRHFPEAQLQLAQLLFQKGSCDSALQHLALVEGEESLRMEKEFIQGNCYIQANQLTQAIQSYTRMLSSSRSFEVLNNLGVAYLRKGDNAMALNMLLEAKGLTHGETTVSLNLAIARHLQGNDAAAKAVIEDAIRIRMQNGMLHFLLGLLLKAQGDDEKGQGELSKAKSLGIYIDKLQSQDPKEWSRILTSWER